MNSDVSSKKTLSCKWPNASLKLLLLTMNNLPRNKGKQALPRMKTHLAYLPFQCKKKNFCECYTIFLPLAVIRGDLSYFHWKKCLWWLLSFQLYGNCPQVNHSRLLTSPPAAQAATSPYFPPSFNSLLAAVVTSRTPVAPNG